MHLNTCVFCLGIFQFRHKENFFSFLAFWSIHGQSSLFTTEFLHHTFSHLPRNIKFTHLLVLTSLICNMKIGMSLLLTTMHICLMQLIFTICQLSWKLIFPAQGILFPWIFRQEKCVCIHHFVFESNVYKSCVYNVRCSCSR